MKRRDKQSRPVKQPTPDRPREMKAAWVDFFEETYRVCYLVGTRSIRCWRSIVRFTSVMWRPIARALYCVLDWLILRHCRRLAVEWRSLREDFTRAGERVHGKQPGLLRQLLTLPLLAVRRHRAMFRTAFNLAAPLLALVVLWSTFSYWQQAEFALALEYGGEQLGYIADENTYMNAAAMVEGLVVDENDAFEVEHAPKLTLTVAKQSDVLDEQAVRDAILEQVSDSVVQTTGLYVDGVFRGALDRDTLEGLMDAILAKNQDPTADHVDFFPQVDLTDGLYPVSAVRTQDYMQVYLETLPIQSVRYETKTQTLAYTTVVEQTTSQPLGYETIKTRGKNGKHKVTEEIITVNGKEQYRSVVSTEVIKAPVNQVIVVGAQKYSENATAGDGIATGSFIWPLPYTKVISSPFASRWGSFHGAIDISNGSTNGKPIIASDGGTVIEAEYHSSYGYYVLIDHGNGYKTRYAHCSKLMVEAGQKVAQGEYIANVGNTGYSFGAHLHFEIIKNGQLVDPLNYVER